MTCVQMFGPLWYQSCGSFCYLKEPLLAVHECIAPIAPVKKQLVELQRDACSQTPPAMTAPSANRLQRQKRPSHCLKRSESSHSVVQAVSLRSLPITRKDTFISHGTRQAKASAAHRARSSLLNSFKAEMATRNHMLIIMKNRPMGNREN